MEYIYKKYIYDFERESTDIRIILASRKVKYVAFVMLSCASSGSIHDNQNSLSQVLSSLSLSRICTLALLVLYYTLQCSKLIFFPRWIDDLCFLGLSVYCCSTHVPPVPTPLSPLHLFRTMFFSSFFCFRCARPSIDRNQ
jgi:hypothetical protein